MAVAGATPKVNDYLEPAYEALSNTEAKLKPNDVPFFLSQKPLLIVPY
jgi:hypothetical protein